MERLACGLVLACALPLALIGCGENGGGSRPAANRERNGAPADAAAKALAGADLDAARDAAADPSVSAELGGKGFKGGEGWLTADPQPLGDPAAKKGGEMRYPIP